MGQLWKEEYEIGEVLGKMGLQGNEGQSNGKRKGRDGKFRLTLEKGSYPRHHEVNSDKVQQHHPIMGDITRDLILLRCIHSSNIFVHV